MVGQEAQSEEQQFITEVKPINQLSSAELLLSQIKPYSLLNFIFKMPYFMVKQTFAASSWASLDFIISHKRDL